MGCGYPVPVRSEGTRNFLLSMSGIEEFDTFSTTTCGGYCLSVCLKVV